MHSYHVKQLAPTLLPTEPEELCRWHGGQTTSLSPIPTKSTGRIGDSFFLEDKGEATRINEK